MTPTLQRNMGIGRRAAPGVRPVLFLTGLVLLSTAALMLCPMIVDIYYGSSDWRAFAVVSTAVGFQAIVAE